MLDDMSDILNSAVTSILDSECDMSYSDVQFSNIDANLEMIQNCVVNDSVQATRLYEALCVLKGHINELLSEAIRQSQHLVRRICIINESIQGSGNIENRLEIRLDELTDILLLVNSDGLLPNIEVSLMNSRDTILGQLGPGRETDVIFHSQLRRIRGEIERCLNHCVVQRRGTIENLHYRLSGLRRDVSTVGARILAVSYTHLTLPTNREV